MSNTQKRAELNGRQNQTTGTISGSTAAFQNKVIEKITCKKFQDTACVHHVGVPATSKLVEEMRQLKKINIPSFFPHQWRLHFLR